MGTSSPFHHNLNGSLFHFESPTLCWDLHDFATSRLRLSDHCGISHAATVARHFFHLLVFLYVWSWYCFSLFPAIHHRGGIEVWLQSLKSRWQIARKIRQVLQGDCWRESSCFKNICNYYKGWSAKCVLIKAFMTQNSLMDEMWYLSTALQH